VAWFADVAEERGLQLYACMVERARSRRATTERMVVAERQGAEPSVIVDPEIYRGQPGATGTTPPVAMLEPLAERDES
jgi:hypothetical protein